MKEQNKNSKGSSTGNTKKSTQKKTLLKEMMRVMLKAIIIVGVAYFMFTKIYVFHKSSGMMAPSIKAGDIVMGFTLDKKVKARDVVIYVNDEGENEYRVIAVEGDEIDIRDNTLYINGHAQAEDYVYNQETSAWSDGVRFPLTVGKDEVFLLADKREEARDSRVFGCVKIDDLKAKVVTIVRKDII